MTMTPKQRMLAAYRGLPVDRVPVAPELWYYYPAKLLGVDMIEFQRSIPFHRALKTVFTHFGCEGWGAAFCGVPAEGVEIKNEERWVDDTTLSVRHLIRTPHGDIASGELFHREEPSWCVERPVKDWTRDLPAFLHASLGDPENADFSGMIEAWREVGESYLLEAWLGVPFFDFLAGSLAGGLEEGVVAFLERDVEIEAIREHYQDYLVRLARAVCEKTPFESMVIGCSWSCNSLLGPVLWRRWDKPVIRAVAEEIHRHGKLLHIHFHGKCMDTVADFAEIGIDCVCPFERPPGGDVAGLEGLQSVARLLEGRTTMNGNIHTVETLIRGTPDDVRREVGEIREAFKGNSRVILGTGDQVGRETPEDNLWVMIEAGHS